MIPEKELEALLRSRLKQDLPDQKIDELLGEIRSLGGTWEEVPAGHRDMGYSMSVNCADICWLADQIYQGAEIKVYWKKKDPAPR